MKVPGVRVDAATARAIEAGRPVVPRSAIRGRPPAVDTGEAVDVCGRAFLGRGLWEGTGPVAVRILTRERNEAIDGAFWARRIRRALHLRRSLLDLAGTDAYRVVNGGGDGLPGMQVDSYSGYLAVTFRGEATRTHLPALGDALRAEVQPRGIYEKRPGVDGGIAVHLGGSSAPDNLSVREGELRFLARLSRGGTTGIHLDMREHRRVLARYARGRAVLNCHSWTGGLSVVAARAGSPRVLSVDPEEEAGAWTRDAFAANGLPPDSHEFTVGDPVDVLGRIERSSRRFDLAVIDTPTFSARRLGVPPAARPAAPAPPPRAATRSRGAKARNRPAAPRTPAAPPAPPDPVAGFRALLSAILPVMRPHGLLAFTVSAERAPPEEVLATLRDAAHDGGTRLQILESHGPPADFPSVAALPEARDATFLVCALRA